MDDNEIYFQALLVQLGPKECLLPQHDTSADAAKMQEVIQRSNILISERKKGKLLNLFKLPAHNDIHTVIDRLNIAGLHVFAFLIPNYQ